jgi:hypothetical protein
VRHIESMIRMSEAVARMRHSAHVSDSDLNMAIKTQLNSFINAQKLGAQRTLRVQFQRYVTWSRSVVAQCAVPSACQVSRCITCTHSHASPLQIAGTSISTATTTRFCW